MLSLYDEEYLYSELPWCNIPESLREKVRNRSEFTDEEENLLIEVINNHRNHRLHMLMNLRNRRIL